MQMVAFVSEVIVLSFFPHIGFLKTSGLVAV